MNTLLLRLVGPLQSWGVQSNFGMRETGREPSKSGVVGLLAAALGRTRDRPVDDLAALRLGVRIDCEGILQRDFHTAGKDGYLKPGGGIERKTLIVSSRYYLADARFLVGLQGDDADLLAQLHAALCDPVWPLFLGRKACVPGEPVWLRNGLRRNQTLLDALAEYPWLGSDPDRYPEQVRLVLEDADGPEVRPDQPLSFAERRFAPRRVRTCIIPAPPIKEAACTSLN